MIFGHNSNVSLGSVKYHVQTEDAGIDSALIDTTVYCGGRVLHRRTNNYHDLLPLNPDREEALKLRLDEQHRQVLEEIRTGVLYLPAPAPPRAASPSAPPSPAPDKASDLWAPPSNASASFDSSSSTTTANPGATPAVANGSDPSRSQLLLVELINSKSWLTGKRATLHLRVSNAARNPVPDAKVTASVFGATEPAHFYTETDDAGEAHLDFEMPPLTDANAALLIESSRGSAKGHVRFQMRARQRIPVQSGQHTPN
jgi:hypothetical protein